MQRPRNARELGKGRQASLSAHRSLAFFNAWTARNHSLSSKHKTPDSTSCARLPITLSTVLARQVRADAPISGEIFLPQRPPRGRRQRQRRPWL